MDNLIKLIEIIIWPATLLLILSWFKDPLKSVFGRMNKLDASASGISVSFSEKLEQAKNKAFDLSRSKGVAKSTTDINPRFESENLKKAREYMSETSLPLSFEFQEDSETEISDNKTRVARRS